jgi:hypothetical protein
MEQTIKYVTTVNPTIEEWKYQDSNVTSDAVIAYCRLLIDNKLNPNDYHPVLGWCYNNDDFIKNRITLVITAEPVNKETETDNYKNHLKP